ncbi:hypothetical protein I9W82_005124 [Candida metapsilosis]|uniref:Uncharacterized protein n=1 Tax=Candida metapsilosis TaxID=273372 RepID=A0A8H7ZBK3_9ASCO|nr:hypothetical protein I9W82_005124 [Candida metapsilosis]
MGIERFVYKPKSKRLVLVLLKGECPSVTYDEDDDVRVYTLKCTLRYKSFIQSLSPTTIILQFHSLTELQELLPVLQDGRVIVYMDPETIKDVTTESTITFQLVRYLCQKFGCDLISKELPMSEVHKIADLDFPINPTYDESHGLYIPHSWDSWDKIVLHGKSVALPEEQLAGVIRDEETLQQLDHTHVEEYLKKWTNPDIVEETKVKAPQSLNEFVQAVYE